MGKMIFKIAMVIMGIIILPLALAILNAIWPIAIALFILMFPLIAIGAIIGWKSKK